MSADVIAWLRTPAGEAWSASQFQVPFYTGRHVSWGEPQGPGDDSEDPCGRGPIVVEVAS